MFGTNIAYEMYILRGKNLIEIKNSTIELPNTSCVWVTLVY